MGTPINSINGLKWEGSDLAKKFNGSYVQASILAHETGKVLAAEKTLVYVRNAGFANHNPHGDTVDCNYRIPFSGAWLQGLVPYTKFLLEEDRPDPCITDISETQSAFFVYNPERQWKRGFGGENSFLYGPGMDRVRHGFTKDVAFNILNPKHSHLEEAITAFKTNPSCVSRALNNLYWLIRKPGDGAYCLWRRRAFIGSIIGKTFFITPSAEILREELLKELPVLRTKYGYAK